MLPHFVWHGLRRRASRELQRRRLSRSTLDWFAPHFEFRFPLLGDVAAPGVELELRIALEPWHVLGEEGARRRHGALRRFVARAPRGARSRGLNERRHVLTCNGRRAAAAAHRHGRRVRRRRALPRLEAAVGAASDHRRACAADLRPRRHLDEPLARRLPVPRRASGRPQLRHLPGQRLRGRGAPPGALLPHGPHARDADPCRPRAANPDFPFTLDLRRPPAPFVACDFARRRCCDQLLAGYAAPEGRYDELLAAPGAAARRTGTRSCARSPTRSEREVSDTLVAAPSGRSATTASPTTSTPIAQGARPAVGARSAPADPRRADEWAQIEAGIAQRADLLNRVLADLYGPQQLLHERR